MKKTILIFIIITSAFKLNAQIDTIVNGETGLSVRTKLNLVIDYLNDSALNFTEIRSDINDTANILRAERTAALASYATKDTLSSYSLSTAISQEILDSIESKLINIDSLILNPKSDLTYQEGKLYYDVDEYGLAFYNSISDVTANIPFEVWRLVRNTTGSTITNGKALRVTGTTGSVPEVGFAGKGSADSSKVIGIATHDISNNAFGIITIIGRVRGLNTSACSEGSYVYLSSNGDCQSTAPKFPDKSIRIGICINSHATQGIIDVHPSQTNENFRTKSVIFQNGDGHFAEDTANFNYTDSEDSLHVNLIDADTFYIGTKPVTSITTVDADTATITIDGNIYKMGSDFFGGGGGVTSPVDTFTVNQRLTANDTIIIASGGNLFLPDAGTDANPTIEFTNGSGIYETSGGILNIKDNNDVIKSKIEIDGTGTGLVKIYNDGTAKYSFSPQNFTLTGGGAAPRIQNLNSNATTPVFIPRQDDTNTGLGSAGNDIYSTITGGVEASRYTEASGQVLKEEQGNAGITASTTQSQGQQVLLSSNNEISTVANANDVVTMPTAVAWRIVRIINNGANTLQIYPSSGDNLGAGVNASITLASGSNATYIAYDATNWETF